MGETPTGSPGGPEDLRKAGSRPSEAFTGTQLDAAAILLILHPDGSCYLGVDPELPDAVAASYLNLVARMVRSGGHRPE